MSRPLFAWMLLAGLITWFLFLPLRDITTYPTRLSVLPNLETDAAAYDAFARDFAQSWHFSALPSKHPPGWMVLLGAVYAIVGHSYVAGKLLSWVALVATVPLCASMAHRVFGPAAAMIAALLCASSPGFRGYVGTLQYEVLNAALFALFLVLTIRVTESPTERDVTRRAVMAGVVAAALVLTRETFVPVVPIAAAWMWTRMRTRTSNALRTARATAGWAAMVLVVVAAAPPVVWSAVQSLHHQRLILISDKGPTVFQLGNNPLANGTYNEPLVGMIEPTGFAFIRSAPLDVLRLAGRKVLYCFGVLRDGWNVPHPAATWIWRATTGAVPLALIEPVVRGGWLLALCIISLATLGADGWRRWWLLPATMTAILLVHVITIGSYRFFVPVLPVLYVLASGPLVRLLRMMAALLRTPAVAVAGTVVIVVAIAAQYQRWPLAVTYQAADLEGIAAANEIDAVSQTLVRVADARRGERPVALLPDTHLPGGSVRLTVRMRRASAPASEGDPAARVMLTQVDGTVACVADILAVQLPINQFVDNAVLCDLRRGVPDDRSSTDARNTLCRRQVFCGTQLRPPVGGTASRWSS